MSVLEDLKRKILLKNKTGYNQIDIWHYLMINYGYIPYDEFLSMDATLVDELVTRLNKMNEEINKRNSQ